MIFKPFIYLQLLFNFYFGLAYQSNLNVGRFLNTKYLSKLVTTSLTTLTIVCSPFDHLSYANADTSNILTKPKTRQLDSFLTQSYDVRTRGGQIAKVTISQGFGAMKGKTPAVGGGDRTGDMNNVIFLKL